MKRPPETRDNLDPIREQMRAARRSLGWSLTAAEEHTGIPAVVIGSWERGDRNPGLTQIRHWVEAFDRRLVVLEPDERVLSTHDAGEEWLSYHVIYGPGEEFVLDCKSEAEAEVLARDIIGAKVGHRVNRRGAIEFGGVW